MYGGLSICDWKKYQFDFDTAPMCTRVSVADAIEINIKGFYLFEIHCNHIHSHPRYDWSIDSLVLHLEKSTYSAVHAPINKCIHSSSISNV